MTISRRLLTASATALVVLCAAVGYLVGSSQAPDPADAAHAQADARLEAQREARDRAYTRSFARGLAKGRTDGRQAGAKEGAAAGESAGSRKVEQRLAAIEAHEQAEAAAAAQAAAEAEEAERAANCGAPLFVDGYCPTDEEIELENAAESLCGPGTAAGQAEAAELGITC